MLPKKRHANTLVNAKPEILCQLTETRFHEPSMKYSAPPLKPPLGSSQEEGIPKSDNFITTNLMAELAIALNNKIKIESENALLKLECDQRNKQEEDFQNKLLQEKTYFHNMFNKLQSDLNKKDIELKERDNRNSEEIKKYLSHINELKIQFEMQNKKNESILMEMQQKLHNIQNEVEALKDVNENLKEKNCGLKEKLRKYRSKFKLAVDLLQRMNSMLQYFYQNRMMISKKCQTETLNLSYEVNGNLPVNTEIPKAQDNILSELFFKPNPFCENLETLFFSRKDVYKSNLL